MSRRLHLLIALTLPALLLGAACSGDDSDSDSDSAATDESEVERPAEIEDLTGQDVVEIEVSDNVYKPRNFRVDPGAEIVFTNVGINEHNVKPATEGAFEPIEVETLNAGPASLTLDTAGDYPLYCSIHGTPTAGQTGYVVVGEG